MKKWRLAIVFMLLPIMAQAITLFGLGPRVGYHKSADADEGKLMIGGAARLKLGALAVEGSIDYRSEEYENGAITVKQWPVSASVLFYPLPIVYGLAGAGWYNTTYEFDSTYFSATIPEKRTEQEMGYHLGAGVELPILQPTITADVRYVFLNYDLGEGLQKVDANFMVFTIGLFWGF
ncbi:outer membrane beta-barrel protein [candidate division KSB1 bacterium]|nr:outer membrane beta-barrel protein [candidate division KSB1 bacterium]